MNTHVHVFWWACMFMFSLDIYLGVEVVDLICAPPQDIVTSQPGHPLLLLIILILVILMCV